MNLEFQDAMLIFLGMLVKQIRILQEDSRLSTAVLNCVNIFLLRNGLDCFTSLLQLHKGQA